MNLYLEYKIEAIQLELEPITSPGNSAYIGLSDRAWSRAVSLSARPKRCN